MIHLRHGNFSKRVGALFCALALVLHFAFAPVRARATLAAGALTAVGFAVTVTAFLNLVGIYPFNPDTGEGLTFPDWTDDALQKLIDLYNVAHASAPLTAQTVKSYALGATIAVANEGWNRLRDFVDWIKSEYAPADNVAGVELGVVSDKSGFISVPVYSSPSTNGILRQNGLEVYAPVQSANQTVGFYVSASASSVYICSYWSSDNDHNRNFVLLSDSSFDYWRTNFNAPDSYVPTRATANLSNGVATGGTRVYYSTFYMPVSEPYTWNVSIPYYSNIRNIDDIMAMYVSSSSSLTGITADTATVTTPAAPVAGSDFTGMQVAGLGQGATADALEDIIESGVQNREQPTVRQVEVEVQAGTEVDSETGEVTENPVVVTPEAVIPAVSELTAPQAFLDALTTTLQTKFPFCLPFDIMRILQAFVKEPQAPLISLSFYDPFSASDYVISVDLSPWDDVAAIVRQFESMLLLVGFWLNFDKFNVLNIILGQLG